MLPSPGSTRTSRGRGVAKLKAIADEDLAPLVTDENPNLYSNPRLVRFGMGFLAVQRRINVPAAGDHQAVQPADKVFDHAGNNGAFPKATFVVQAEHLAFAKGKPNFPGVYWDIPELTYVGAAGRSRVARGVEVVPTPGHAPGHQSLVVDLPETGRVVLTGDAAFTRANLERGEIPAMDEAAARESLALIRSLVGDDLTRVFTSHDADAWSTWRHAPDPYR